MSEVRTYKGSGTRYTPVSGPDRVNRVRKPADPRAVRFHGDWFLPLQLLADRRRRMPETRPDTDAAEHSLLCRCKVCMRPEAERWRRRRLRSL